MLETLDYTMRIGSTSTFLYFDFCYYKVHLYNNYQGNGVCCNNAAQHAARIALYYYIILHK